MIGFANKGNAKRTLENNFTKNEDYKLILLPREKKQNAGRCEEEIMLNIKIDNKSRTIIEEYKSLTIASNMLKLHESTIRNFIQNKQVINDSFILQYKKDLI
jgi:hypothetical protein